MRTIGSLLEKWLQGQGYYRKIKQQQAVLEWDSIVGEKVAASAQAEKIEKGVLWVRVKNSVWMHHLTMMKGDIIKKINHYTGNKDIQDLYFFLGEEEYFKEKGSSLKEQERGDGDNKGQEEIEATEKETLPEEEVKAWLDQIPEEERHLKGKIERLLYKRYHIRG